MKVHFYSISETQKTSYKGDFSFEDGCIVFVDQSTQNTMQSIKIINNQKILLKRTGSTNQKILFDSNKKTIGTYSDELGFDFEFIVDTKNIELTDDKIYIEYDLLIDNINQGTFKIYLLIKNLQKYTT